MPRHVCMSLDGIVQQAGSPLPGGWRRLLVLSQLPIRKKILCGTVMLTVTLLLLMWCSLTGVYAYRQLAQMISQRAAELPITARLQKEIDNLRFGFRLAITPMSNSYSFGESIARQDRNHFRMQLESVRESLKRYESQIRGQVEVDQLLSDRTAERELVRQISTKLEQIRRSSEGLHWHLEQEASLIEDDLEQLGQYVHKLPTFLQNRMAGIRDEVRNRYRTWIALIVLCSITSLAILGVSFWFFRTAMVKPFRTLLDGSRLVARGNFEHRIRLAGHDELAELAAVLNSMTDRFLEIRENLNRMVQERTREVVRSEQLASVGFLAAGVAHEINNPLASIAWSAEALESRLHEILHCQAGEQASSADPRQIDVLRKYLKRIQDEAFRCKGITDRLLDFSRLNDTQRKQETDVNQLIEDVIGLVEHLGQYRSKRIEFTPQKGLMAWVSPPELKQVVLNLLTNALDSIDDGHAVQVQLQHDRVAMKLVVTDDGCGMSTEVLQHLFEPFFTRRRDGRGTGLGLSITYRIIQDHGGTIEPSSAGPGKGSRFEVTLPLEPDSTPTYEPINKAA